MGLLLRYACLLGLGLGSVFLFVNATAATGQKLIAANGYAIHHPEDFGFWVLAGIGILGLLSVFKFLFSGIPGLVRDWYDRHKTELAAMMLAVLICAVFVVA